MAAPTTPLVPAPSLSAALGVEVWLKRDDLTGQGLGGNKVRGLEYLLADAEQQRADVLLTGAGPQSNWAMLAALTARTRGLDPHLVFYGTSVPPTGNLLLASRTGATIRFTGEEDRASVDQAIEAWAAELRAAGRTPYVLPRGGATALGAMGYVHASLELAQQMMTQDLRAEALWVAAGSCGTQGGLVAGTRWLHLAHRIVGVTVSRGVEECRTRVAELADGALELLGEACGGEDDIWVVDGYLGPGYGVASEAGDRAAELVLRTEGVLLDPVFAAKAMAALVDAADAGRIDGPVVFLVSGGAPTLFTAGGSDGC